MITLDTEAFDYVEISTDGIHLWNSGEKKPTILSAREYSERWRKGVINALPEERTEDQ